MIKFTPESHQQYFEFLCDFNNLFNLIKVPIYLYGGTLLGAVREEKFIVHDDDIDVFIICEGRSRKEALQYFETKIVPVLQNEGYTIEPISWSISKNNPRVMLGQYHINKGEYHIDLWLGWFDTKDFYLTMTIEGQLKKEDILPSTTLKLYGRQFNVPNKYKDFLKHLYGSKWETPDSKYKIPSNDNFLQKKVVRVIDQYGWAYDFTSREQKKYSWQDVEIIKIEALLDYLKTNVTAPDVIYLPAPSCGLGWVCKCVEYMQQNRKKFHKTVIIGGYSGLTQKDYPKSDLNVSISYTDLEAITQINPTKPTVFLPESVDTEYFAPKKTFNKEFKVGWAGRECPEKRTHLLDKLAFKVVRQQNHGKEYFTLNRPLDPMKEFYASIDCYVLTSYQECMPRVVLEAMASGLPVIATDCDSIRLLLSPEWIVPINPEEDCVKEINIRLTRLANNPKLRETVGKRNRSWVEKYFSWKENQKLWDRVYSALYKKDIPRIKNLSNEYINAITQEIEQENNHRILKVIDEYGWAYHFVGTEQQRYSTMKIDMVPIKVLFDARTTTDWSKYSAVYFHSPAMWTSCSNALIKLINENKIKLIGGYGGEIEKPYPDAIDLVVAISLKFITKLKEMYPNKTVVWLPEAVDTDYFVPTEKYNKEFTVGWAGRPCKVKRHYLLDKLNYPIVKQQNWGKATFVKDRTLTEMKSFYSGIDVFVLTSSSECMPRVVLEAMACGLPVVSTDVGSLRLVLDSAWLIAPEDETYVVSSMNACLKMLEEDPELRRKVGERNRQWVEKYLSWKTISPLWDKIVLATIHEDHEEIKRLADDYLSQFGNLFCIDNYFGQMKKEPIIEAPIVEQPQPPVIEIKETPKKEILPEELNTQIKKFLAEAKKKNIIVTIIDQSCLECVKHRKIITPALQLEVKYDYEKQELVQIHKTYHFTFELVITQHARPTKGYSLLGLDIKVPFPVLNYLKSQFPDINLGDFK